MGKVEILMDRSRPVTHNSLEMKPVGSVEI